MVKISGQGTTPHGCGEGVCDGGVHVDGGVVGGFFGVFSCWGGGVLGDRKVLFHILRRERKSLMRPDPGKRRQSFAEDRTAWNKDIDW